MNQRTPPPFGFARLVPGFDFLQNPGAAATSPSQGAAGAMAPLPGFSSWVAPTLSVQEIDKRIQELKAVQFWLNQNATALKATIQALEVQKMTLATLQAMNVSMAELASSFQFKPQADPPAQPAAHAQAPQAAGDATPAPPQDAKNPARADAQASQGTAAGAAAALDPLQWWGALTQQFQQIASAALQDVAQKPAREPAAPPKPTSKPVHPPATDKSTTTPKARAARPRPAARKATPPPPPVAPLATQTRNAPKKVGRPSMVSQARDTAHKRAV